MRRERAKLLKNGGSRKRFWNENAGGLFRHAEGPGRSGSSQLQLDATARLIVGEGPRGDIKMRVFASRQTTRRLSTGSIKPLHGRLNPPTARSVTQAFAAGHNGWAMSGWGERRCGTESSPRHFRTRCSQ